MPDAIDDVAPTASVLAYDEQHAKTYLHLLDAEAESADWKEAARIVLHIDPEKEHAASSRRASPRAHWMTKHGYSHLARGRPLQDSMRVFSWSGSPRRRRPCRAVSDQAGFAVAAITVGERHHHVGGFRPDDAVDHAGELFERAALFVVVFVAVVDLLHAGRQVT
jgi:hypothetical protein